MAKGHGVSRDWLSNFKGTLTTGYIVLPNNFTGDQGRRDFIQTCYRRERVSVQFEYGGGVKHECFITHEALQNIIFPDLSINEDGDGSKLGSQVLIMNEPFTDQSFIIGVVSKSDETKLLSECEYRILKGKDGNYAILSLDGKTGTINISTFGVSDGGDLNINISNQNKNANLNVNVVGGINISSTGDVNVYMKGDINLTPSTFNVGSENLEPSLKGTTTSDELIKDGDAMKELQNALNNWTPVPNDGGAALKVALTTFLTKVMADYSNIKSSKCFLE